MKEKFKPEVKICKCCKKEFTTTRKRQTSCSKECTEKQRKSYQKILERKKRFAIWVNS